MTKLDSIIKKSGLTENDLVNLIKNIEKNPKPKKKKYTDYLGTSCRVGVFSDCHIGQKEFDEQFFIYMADMFKKNSVDRVYQSGDILEGMSGRDGQIYDLTHIGFNQQINYASRLFNKYLSDFEIYGIDGNHDSWFKIKANGGAIVGEELELRVKNYHHLGEMEADIEIGKGINLKLFHPGDGTAYATSYKLQKLMESFTGGEKPNILIEGHYHKALYMFNRNIHGLEAGTLCGQTQWMRGKKIAAHKGFWILDIEFNKGGIGKFCPTFYPSYE